MKFETAAAAATRLGVTARAVQKWAKEGKLEGAKKVGRDWMIPINEDATDNPTKQSNDNNSINMPYPFFQAQLYRRR